MYALEEQVRAEEARVAAREEELAAMARELESVEARVGAAQRQLARLEASANDPDAAGSVLAQGGEEEGEEGEEGGGETAPKPKKPTAGPQLSAMPPEVDAAVAASEQLTG